MQFLLQKWSFTVEEKIQFKVRKTSEFHFSFTSSIIKTKTKARNLTSAFSARC